MSGVIVQIFGTKERGIRVQSVDLGEKGLSPGEPRSVAARVGGGNFGV